MARTAIHPGEILKDELEELELSANKFAKLIEVPANRISAILAGKRDITVDTALRLARYFGMSHQFWLNLQNTYDVDKMDETVKIKINQLPTIKNDLNIRG